MNIVLIMLTVQALMGGFDNLWHHELSEDLPHKPSARKELALHTGRELLYALIFASIAWVRWEGAWTFVLLGVFAVEIGLTLWDFMVEDQTRRLPKFERILHTVLAIDFGAILAVWAPELVRWATAPTGFGGADYGILSWLMTAFGIGVFLWGIRDLLAVVRLGTPQWQRHPLRAGASAAPRTILVTGATGFIGGALTRALVENGDHVIALSRSPEQAGDRFGPLVEICGDLDAIATGRRIDAIVNLAGAPLATGPWTRSRKRRFVESRLAVTGAVTRLIERLEHKPEALISGSAIGYYGDRGEAELTEASSPQDIFMSELCGRWELAAARAEQFGVRVCCLRIGLVLGKDGGALAPMLLTTRLGLGAIMGSGTQIVSWIHRDDLIRLIRFAIDEAALNGPINATAPNPVSHTAFMGALAAAVHRRIRLRLPAVMLRAAIGELSSLFLSSQRVLPQSALAAGFQFELGELADAFAEIAARPAAGEGLRATTVYLNDECPVCNAEMQLYRREATSTCRPVIFKPVSAVPNGIATCGLGNADLRRRLFVADRRGELLSGVDAFIVLWRELPRYRWAARLVALPGVYQLCSLLYDGGCVPVLAAWNRRRQRLQRMV
jgi:uncharacterized protein (TIGR01777 family)